MWVVVMLCSPGSECWKSPAWPPSCGKGPGVGRRASQGTVPEGMAGEGVGMKGVRHPTSFLGLNGDDTLTLWPEAFSGLGLHLELVGHILP